MIDMKELTEGPGAKIGAVAAGVAFILLWIFFVGFFAALGWGIVLGIIVALLYAMREGSLKWEGRPTPATPESVDHKMHRSGIKGPGETPMAAPPVPSPPVSRAPKAEEPVAAAPKGRSPSQMMASAAAAPAVAASADAPPADDEDGAPAADSDVGTDAADAGEPLRGADPDMAPPAEPEPEAEPAAPEAVAEAVIVEPASVEEVEDEDPAGEDEGLVDTGTKPEAMDGPRGGEADDLKMIRGVGPKLEEMLHGLGIYHFDQIAAWGPDEVAWCDSNLKGFKGRVSRDEWVSQAGQLAAGEQTEFAARAKEGDIYGGGGSAS